MKTSELLRRAKALLPKHFFVCDSLGAAAFSYPGPERIQSMTIGMHLLDRVTQSIYPHANVSDWLIAQHKVPYSDMTREALLDYRQRWLGALIAEYEAKGD